MPASRIDLELSPVRRGRRPKSSQQLNEGSRRRTGRHRHPLRASIRSAPRRWPAAARCHGPRAGTAVLPAARARPRRGKAFGGPLTRSRTAGWVHNAGGGRRRRSLPLRAGESRSPYLRALEAGGTALDAARAMIYFPPRRRCGRVPVGWRNSARCENCGLRIVPAAWRPRPCFHCRCNRLADDDRQRDAYVNLLRTTIATVAAGLGGADAVTVLPFTQACGLPDRLRSAPRAEHPAAADRGNPISRASPNPRQAQAASKP